MSNRPTPVAITSRDNSLLVKVRKLAQDATAYRKAGEFWLEGDNLASACLARGVRPRQCIVTDDAWAQPTWRAWAEQAERVAVVSASLFKGISGLESPAQIGFLVGWTAQPAVQAGVRTVVLDRLQDAGNVGTILRSASALGVQQVVALKGTAALWSPKVLRAAMGAHFGLHLVESAEPEALGDLGVPLLATSSHSTDTVMGVALPDPCAWVLGHEGQGVDAAILARCDRLLTIPQPGGEESLNVAAAASICLYESMRQRLARRA